MAVPARSSSSILLAVATLAIHAAGCTRDGEPGAVGETDTAAAIGVAPPPAGDTTAAPPALESASLPREFPADFPVPPESSVTNAVVQTDADGTLTNVTILSAGDPETVYAWYRDGLTRAGWTVTAESVAADAWTLHAEQGESYIDLTVIADPASGRTRANAAIWKTHR